MTQLITGDIASTDAELMVVPQSTAGTISKSFQNIISQRPLLSAIRPMELGEVNVISQATTGPWRFIAFASSVNQNTSSYSAIYKIVRNLAKLIPQGVNSIAMPLLGTGAGNLDSDKVYYILVRSLAEFLPKIDIKIYTIDKELAIRVRDRNVEPKYSAVKLTFDFLIEEMTSLSWVSELMLATDFYFEFAEEKFVEYLNWHSSEVNFKHLLNDFKDSKTVFSKYLERIDEKSQSYRFLVICGELISYIDRHAYNKQIWNRYQDKRTMALSSVNQTRWVENLIAFKASANDYSVLTPSIRNAFNYLGQPSENVTMLSVNHRLRVAQVLFDKILEEDLLPALSQYFKGKGIFCNNHDNNGVLYSRILYTPDVKSLWVQDRIVSESNIIQSNLIPLLEEEVISEESKAETARRRNLKMLMYSDLYASVDLLNYETYASIIARLITSNLSTPPFNIAIVAPWGKGKTSLMKFIQKKINPTANLTPTTKERSDNSMWTILSWLKLSGDLFKDTKKLDYPVIWFNAWKFQKSEQIWAGLADEIIRQLTAQLNNIDREKFWLKLNLKRVDRDKLKRELLFKLIGKYTIPFIYLIIGILVALLPKLTNIAGSWDTRLFTLFYSFIGSGSIVLAVRKILEINKKPAELDVSRFVLQPEYRPKMGYLQSVEDDLRQAIGLIVNPEKPAVIFVDDLDRCSPTVISEVVEAINAFTSGDLSNCYFVIGQDLQMITASLDSAYEKIAGKIGKLENNESSIGRFFMEKFSQLTITVPVMAGSQKQRFMETLLAGLDLENIPNEPEQKKLLEDYRKLELELDSLENPEDIFTENKERLETKIRMFDSKAVAVFQDKILGYAFKNFAVDDNELENLVDDIAEYLDSPRTIKRFINLFLFYHFFRFTIPGRAFADIDDYTLSRWLVIMVRWPIFAQAVQWDSEKGFLSGATPEERAINFDNIINNCDNYQKYLQALNEKTPGSLEWLADPDLFNICKEIKTDEKIYKILASGIW